MLNKSRDLLNMPHSGQKPDLFKCSTCAKTFQLKSNMRMHQQVHLTLKEREFLKQFQCHICHKKFRTRQHLNVHIGSVHIKEKPYKCDICNKGFTQSSHMKLHKRTHLSVTERKLQCSICPKTFLGKTGLANHISQHHSNNPKNVCGICSKTFSTNYDLKKHHSTHLSETKKTRIKCERCPKSFLSRSGIIRHTESEHMSDIECPVPNCKKILVSRFTLRRHLETHKGFNDREKRECSICGKLVLKIQYPRHIFFHKTNKPVRCGWPNCGILLSGPESLRCHINRCHNAKATLQCWFCSKMFKIMADLNKHLAVHTNEKPYQCDICQKWFRTSSYLTTHKKIHLDAGSPKPRVHACAICPGTFSQKSGLNQHIKRMHLKLKPKKCNQCAMSFVTTAEIKAHQLQHSDPAERLKFICSQCPKQYYSKYALTCHIRGAHEGNSFKCPYPDCGKQFEVHANLRAHSIIHNSQRKPPEKLFKCDYCPKTFSQNSNKTTHLKRVHLKERSNKCSKCHKAFCTLQELAKHGLQHFEEGQRPRSQCSQCEKSFLDPRALKKHISLFHLMNGIGCPFQNCGMKFATHGDCNRHSITHAANRESNKVKCTQCSAYFMSSASLKSHILRAHTENNKRFFCTNETCKFGFCTRTELNAHAATHLEEADRPVLRCGTCSKTFISKSTAYKHKQSCGTQSSQIKIPCNVEGCSKAFLGQNYLKQHVKRVHMAVANYPCGFCPKLMITNYERENHTRSHHTKEKPFKCAYCTRKFSQGTSCRAHENKKHKNSGINNGPVFCPLCGSKYSSKAGLAVHIKTIHEKRRPYKCSLCDSAFQNSSCLNKHITCVHTKEKHFKCKCCGYATSSKGYFRQHTKIHDENNKKVCCYFCDKRFHTFGALKAHFYLHTTERWFFCCSCNISFLSYGSRNTHQKMCRLKSL